tara:strand:- start:190 stop:423 length:234 start_codon:yes stop_codon:yes gene_type:complete
MLLADLGCTEIKLAEAAMPGLMTLSEVFGAAIEYLCEKVAASHLAKIGVELETLRKVQSDCICVTVEVPFKQEQYGY